MKSWGLRLSWSLPLLIACSSSGSPDADNREADAGTAAELGESEVDDPTAARDDAEADDAETDDAVDAEPSSPAASGSTAPANPAEPSAGPATSSAEPSTPAEPGTDTPPRPASEACLASGALPAAFARNCASCHSSAGTALGNAPDLFAFEQPFEVFLERVRSGGETMPGFASSVLGDAELQAIYTYFQSSNEASAAGFDGTDVDAAACAGEPLIGDECSGVSEPVSALYGASESTQAALTSVNPDGSLVLRAGGRVRGRHEREADFSPYHAQYFENRSYTFIVEDTLPAGGNTLKVTWLPLADAGEQTINFRYWYTGDGNVFHTNVGMSHVQSLHWEHVVEYNAREGRELQLGDRLEFEFGVFFDPNVVDGRTSYYSDTFRYVIGSGKLTPFDDENPSALSGGDTTIPYIFVEPELYFEQMALNIQGDNAQLFLEGRRLFHTDFETGEHSEGGNPAFEAQAGKAGPLLNQTECVSCHENNGRGAPPAAGELAETLVFKTGTGAQTEPGTEGPWGRQLQTSTSDGGSAEGNVRVTYAEEIFEFADGEQVTLRRPSFELQAESDSAVALSARMPRPVIGLGLLEAVSETTLLSFADAADCNADGISGRPNLIEDPSTAQLRIGRFGWKAGKVDVQHQVADALQLDMGVTTRLFSVDDCGASSGCDTQEAAAELSDEDLARLVSYVRLLAVPPRRDVSDAAVARGQTTFAQLGCASCHLPTLQTSDTHPLLELRSQVIHPYTDLLLHDLGPDLADDSVLLSSAEQATEGRASAAEWRTAPLWGLGLAATVDGAVHLLHDGRAQSIVEAILWHGGEASQAKQAFAELPKEQREELLRFLESL